MFYFCLFVVLFHILIMFQIYFLKLWKIAALFGVFVSGLLVFVMAAPCSSSGKWYHPNNRGTMWQASVTAALLSLCGLLPSMGIIITSTPAVYLPLRLLFIKTVICSSLCPPSLQRFLSHSRYRPTFTYWLISGSAWGCMFNLHDHHLLLGGQLGATLINTTLWFLPSDWLISETIQHVNFSSTSGEQLIQMFWQCDDFREIVSRQIWSVLYYFRELCIFLKL